MSNPLTWQDTYGCYRAHLFGQWYLNVNWDSTRSKNAPENHDGNYIISACGHTCKKRAKDIESGKLLAVQFARKLLTDALATLPKD